MTTLRSRRLLFLPLACCLWLSAAHAQSIRTMPFTVSEPPVPEKAPLLLRAARALTDFGADHGESCRARVWLRQENGNRGPLLMYRHGGSASAPVIANMGGAHQQGAAKPEQPFEPLLSKELRRDRLPDFATVLAFTSKANPSQAPVVLTLELVKGGSCTSVKGEDCEQAIGYLVNRFESGVWRLDRPVPVIVEDSCAKSRHGNFIDAKPFYKKIGLPH